jgi:hypothetical protein
LGSSNRRCAEKFVSPSDPAAQWTGAHKGPAFFAYSRNYLINVKFGVIVDVEASRSIRQAEVGTAKTMLERTEERFGLKPFTVDGFSDFMRDAITAAGLPLDCQPHGLRKAAGRQLAEAGCSTKQIMAVLGHNPLRKPSDTRGKPIKSGSQRPRFLCSRRKPRTKFAQTGPSS